MVASRTRPAGALSGPLLLSAICAGFAPSSIGYQDLAGFFVRQPIVSEGRHEHLVASPFGTIHAATFSFARPLGTALSIPLATQPVSFDPQSLDVKTWSADEPAMGRLALPIEYPSVNRRLKGDRMPLPQAAPSSSNPEGLPAAQPVNAPASRPPISPVPAIGHRPKDAEGKGETRSLQTSSASSELRQDVHDADA